MVAAAHGRLQDVQALLSAGADPTIIAKPEQEQKLTAYDWAKLNGHQEVSLLTVCKNALPQST